MSWLDEGMGVAVGGLAVYMVGSCIGDLELRRTDGNVERRIGASTGGARSAAPETDGINAASRWVIGV